MTSSRDPMREIDGGYHIKDLPDGRCIDVMKMFFNWRIVRSTGHETGYDMGFCYFATTGGRSWLSSLVTAVQAAQEWSGEDGTEPKHYDKRAL